MEDSKTIQANEKTMFSMSMTKDLYLKLKETSSTIDLTMTNFVTAAIREKIEKETKTSTPLSDINLSGLENKLDNIVQILQDIHQLQQKKIDSLKTLL